MNRLRNRRREPTNPPSTAGLNRCAASPVNGVKTRSISLPPLMDPETGPILDVYRLPGFEEPFSAMSHLVGTVLFAFLGYGLLLRGRGDRQRLVYLGVYAFSCVLLFSMSGVYHMMERGGTAQRPRPARSQCDLRPHRRHLHADPRPAARRLATLGAAPGHLGAAIAGVCLKSIFYEDVAEWISLSLYLGMGWFGGYGGIFLALVRLAVRPTAVLGRRRLLDRRRVRIPRLAGRDSRCRPSA